MIKFYRVTPVSVVFFRDPRPFVAGEHSLARLQFPPRLTPFLGALRTEFLEEMAKREKQDISKIFEKYKDTLGKISIVWFSMIRDGQPIFPMPFDTFAEWKSLPNERFIYENSLQEKESIKVPILQRSSNQSITNRHDSKVERKSFSFQYITLKGFLQYQSGSLPTDFEILSLNTLWDFENRVGIALKPDTKTAERSKFYRTTVARPRPGVGFLVGVEFPDDTGIFELFNNSFNTRLGGEGHVAVWEKIEGIEVSYEVAQLKSLVALSHIPIKNSGEPYFEVTNWCINKLDFISGWDYKENRPKPLETVIKPGSVLHVKQIKGTEKIKSRRIHFADTGSVEVLKDFIVSVDGQKMYLNSYKPELGVPDALFVIKN